MDNILLIPIINKVSAYFYFVKVIFRKYNQTKLKHFSTIFQQFYTFDFLISPFHLNSQQT